MMSSPYYNTKSDKVWWVCLGVFLALYACVTFATPTPTQAQIPGSSNGITLSMTPTYPQPGETVTVRAEKSGSGLERAVVTWSVNGSRIAEGVGVREIEILAGPLGSVGVVSVSAFVDGALLREQIVLRPADVDIIWQADTYVPPLYQGKALQSPGGTATFMAFPHLVDTFGRRVSSTNIVFSWEHNGQRLSAQSGLGKDTLLLNIPFLLGSNTVVVTASTLDGSVTAKRALSFRPVEPELLFYENDPLLGMLYERAIQNTFVLANEEVDLSAQPFFLFCKKSH